MARDDAKAKGARERLAAPRRIGILGFDGVQALDLVGVADAFASDALVPGMDGAPADGRRAPYEVVIIGLTGRTVRTTAGFTIRAQATVPTAMRLDTLVIPGGQGLRRPGVAERAADWIGRRAGGIRRIASVCTGIYGLAATGLLDGRRVTTHWSAAADVARRYPSLVVDPDAVYVKDGRFYTSAGVTAGIDLSLAMIEEDLGPRTALAVAREMVVFFRRPGGQQQFSEPLRFQFDAADRFADLVAWIRGNLRADLAVQALAERVSLSPRQFARAFRQRFDATPGAFVEEMRLAEGSRRLAERAVGVAQVAHSVGYASADVFRRAFERRYGVAPRDYRLRFGASVSAGTRGNTR